jgi:hypothetical protein
VLRTAVTSGSIVVAVGVGIVGLMLLIRQSPQPPSPKAFDTQAALNSFVETMKETKTWNTAMTKVTVAPTDFDTLIITMTPQFELQEKRLRLVFAKSLANAWEHIDKHPDARPSIRLEDSRGQKIGGSTWLGEVEVDE